MKRPRNACKRLRLFLDSNVLTGGIVSRWGLDRAILSLCAARIFQLVLAEVVRQEVEENLLLHAAKLDTAAAATLLQDYAKLVRLTRPLKIPFPPEQEVVLARHLIRHAADVPVLISALKAAPDWLLTHNTKHFTPQVAARSGLRIATPVQFFAILADSIAPHSS